MALSEELKVLCHKAIADPASITRVEHNLILGLPPPNEEDRLCQVKVALSKQELIAKAIAQPDELSELEANIIIKGVTYDPEDRAAMDAALDKLLGPASLPVEDLNLKQKAQGAVQTSDELKAWGLAYDRRSVFIKQRLAERDRQRDRQRADMRAAMNAPRPKWIQDILDAQLPQWGFVCFRTAYGDRGGVDDAAWAAFQAYYMQTGEYVLRHWRGGAGLWPMHRTVFVSEMEALDGASMEALRAKFRTMREAGEIPLGIRQDCFLVADEAVLRDECITTGERYSMAKIPVNALFLRGVDPDHDPSTPIPTTGNHMGFSGEIMTPLPKVFDWLYYTFLANSEAWTTRYAQTKMKQWRPAMLSFSTYPGY